MKKKWFRTMDLVDEAYILEADPGQRVSHINKRRVGVSLLASAACLALALSGLWLFAPYDTTPPDIGVDEGDHYYSVIQQLQNLTWEKPEYSNNFEKYIGEFSALLGGARDDIFTNGVKGEDMVVPEGAAPGAGLDVSTDITDSGADGAYKEITDNQVAGITEADRIKRSDTHIYYLDKNTLRVFSIAGQSSAETGSFSLLEGEKQGYLDQWEFYLSGDCKTATVITSQFDTKEMQRYVTVLSLDVSDPANITEKNRVKISGQYLSSRLTDGKMLLMTQLVLDTKAIDFEQERTFLPQINGQSIAEADIYLPQEANSARYTVVMKLDEATLAMEGTAAFLSYTEDVYVSQDHIFLTHVYADVKQEEGQSVRNSMTEITCLTYQESFEKKGAVTVRGYVKDQWSMDEYEGILRVVTTTNATTVRQYQTDDSIIPGGSVSSEILSTATGNSNASLYCVDLQNFAIVAKVEDFAPPREEVQSVRFDKTAAYVCTSIEMSDPVFFFDLSNLNKITYKDTGTIEGFSTSLVNFADGYLLGIGQGDWGVFKAEVYQETADGVKGVCQYTLQDASYAQSYKAYYIDRENQLVGLGIQQYGKLAEAFDGYILLRFDGYELVELMKVELPGNNAFKRGVYIDGFMYLFGESAFRAEPVF